MIGNSKWTSVSIKPPEDEGLVLVCRDNGLVEMASVYFYYGKLYFSQEATHGKVLFWQPRPKLPRFFIKERIKMLVEQHGYNISTLAEKMGVHNQSVSCWLRGDYLPNKTNMIKLCEALGCSMEELEGDCERLY